jgi:hypothetical protein
MLTGGPAVVSIAARAATELIDAGFDEPGAGAKAAAVAGHTPKTAGGRRDPRYGTTGRETKREPR